MQRLSDKLVQLHIVESISCETIRQVLEHNELKPWLNKQWCIPPKNNAEFVYQMEEVLTVYTRPGGRVLSHCRADRAGDG